MSEPRLMQTLPSLGARDHERSLNHRCLFQYNPPKSPDTLGTLRSVDHRSAERTNGGQKGRLPSFDPRGGPLYSSTIDPDSRLQPVHLGKDGPSTREYRPFGGNPDSTRPQLPSVSDILKTSSQSQHSYHRPSSAHRVAMEPFERERSNPSSLPPAVTPDRTHTSPLSNVSAPSSTSCELESLAGRLGSEMRKATSISRQHTVFETDVEGSFRRHGLGGHGEGNLPSHSEGHRLSVSTRQPSRRYSPEGSASGPASLMAAADSSRFSSTKEGQERGCLNDHKVLPGDSHGVYERLDRNSMAASSYLCSGREPERDHHPISAYSAAPGTTYRSNQRHEPIGQHRFPQSIDVFGAQRCAMTTGVPNGAGHSVHAQAEDKLSSLIWDGNRFLPRLVRTETVPGKGLCYFYDDGSHCKAKIDGEDVNPSWGVTKAGKPRKRLAVACITCREKKIKCDPDYPKCKQCVKFDRVCMFKNAARAAQILKETYASGNTSGDVGGAPSMFQAPHSGQCVESRADYHSALEDSLTGVESTMSKKRKPVLKFDSQESLANGYNQLFMEGGLGQPAKKRRAASPATVLKMLSGALGSNSWSGEFDWETDPYEAYPELVDHLMDLYFNHINATMYCMFPRKPFRKWLRSGEKSPDDRMLIYAMLALASRFSTDPGRKTLARNLQATAQYAIEHQHGKFSLQLVQSRLAFSLYCFAANNSNEAYEYCGAGIRAALAMRLNIDNGASDLPDDDTFEYGLNRHAIAECRRRTFWSAYLMDRFSGFSAGRAGLISNDDIFVRLPCHDELFDNQEEISIPFFDKAAADSIDVFQSGREREHVGPMAFLIEISFIWGDVLAEIYRSANRQNGACAATYEAFRSKTQRRLSRWLASLPLDLVYTEENMSLSSKSGHLGSFLTMHSLYHATRMKLNRYVRLGQLSRERVIENLRELDKHAREQLQMMICFRHGLQLQEPLEESLGIPFTGYATSSACDVLSAMVPRDKFPEILRLLSQGLSVLEGLQNHWHTCRKHKTWILRRMEKLENSDASHLVSREDPEGTADSHSPIIIECFPQPMEAPVCAVDDIAYSVDQDIYREAITRQPDVQNGYGEPREASVSQKALSPSSVLESADGRESEAKG